MKDTPKKKQFSKDGKKQKQRAFVQAGALRENLRRRKKPKPEGGKDR